MASLLEMKALIKSAWARYACDSFGNDTVGHFIWERVDKDLDLVMGDGSDTDTFPLFVAVEDHDTAYYSFDGVDDHVSAWPTMPEAYTVIAALSDSYPDGQPYTQICNDDTIETLLTTPGALAGNLHSIIIFDSVLDADDLAIVEQRMLSRLWRETVVDPFTERMIRIGDCALCLYCEDETYRFDDYSANAIGITDYSTVWDDGLTFPVGGAAVVMDADAELNLDAITIFIESPNFDIEASAETILENGTNYLLEISQAADICTLSFNGSEFSFSATGKRTLAVTCEDGEKPLFYLNGQYAGEGDIVAAVSSAGGDQLTIGNNVARDNPFASTVKKISIYNRALTAGEIMAAHIMARQAR